MSTIGLCMIVKNEQDVLDRCLKSAKDIMDEIVIVDTGSTDETKNIAKKYTNKVFDFEWCDNFSKARNYAFSLSSCDYIMWLDADDVIPTKTANQLKIIKRNLTADVYMLKYDIAFYNNKPTFSYFRERIIRNCNLAIWQGVVHECITPFGKVERLNIPILHKKEVHKNSDRNLKIYNKAIRIRTLSPREMYYYGRELFDHKKYKQCVKILNKFVDSKLGWQENIIDALFLISVCEKNLNNPKKSLFALFKTFEYDVPRANVCCHIGDNFFLKKEYEKAIYWYNLALKCKDVSFKGGFVQKIYYNYYPYLQLCCCHFYLKNIDQAIKYNKKAGQFYNSEIVQNNNKFFKNYIKN